MKTRSTSTIPAWPTGRHTTEMGFVIHSPRLAAALAKRIAERVHAQAYEVHLVETDPSWTEQRNDGEQLYAREPHVGFWRRVGVKLLSLLPIEELL